MDWLKIDKTVTADYKNNGTKKGNIGNGHKITEYEK